VVCFLSPRSWDVGTMLFGKFSREVRFTDPPFSQGCVKRSSTHFLFGTPLPLVWNTPSLFSASWFPSAPSPRTHCLFYNASHAISCESCESIYVFEMAPTSAFCQPFPLNPQSFFSNSEPLSRKAICTSAIFHNWCPRIWRPPPPADSKKFQRFP